MVFWAGVLVILYHMLELLVGYVGEGGHVHVDKLRHILHWMKKQKTQKTQKGGNNLLSEK